MKKLLFILICFLPTLISTTANAQDLSNIFNRLQDATKQLQQPSQKKEVAPKETTETTISQNSNSSNTNILTAKDIGKIPRSDEFREDELAEFNKNWRNKKLSFLGKVNRSGGISIDEYYINGCNTALKGITPGTTVVATGLLKARDSGGSGGEPVEINACSIEIKQSLVSSAQTNDGKSSETAIATKEIKLGYLKGSIKIAETYGCLYALKSDSKKQRETNQIGNDSDDGTGVVINVDGRDVLVKGSYDNKGVFSGVFDGYRFLIPKNKNFFEITKSPNYKLQIPVVGQCSD